jgi:hypothetical protein
VPGSSRTSPADQTPARRKGTDMLKKIVYSLGALAMLAMAVGAGFKPN